MPAGRLTRDEARARAELLSNLSYDLALELSDSPTAATFDSTTTIELDCARAGADTFLDLEAASVTRAELNGEELPRGAHDGHRLALRGLAAGRNRVAVRARCSYQHTGVGLHRAADPVDGRVYLWTHFEPFDAHKVFACFDQPDLKGTFSLRVTAPAGWTVIANEGVMREEDQPGTLREMTFGPTPPISTYLVAVAAGPFHAVRDHHGDTPLGLFCRGSLAEHLDPDEIFAITKGGLDFFGRYFDHPYPFSKYDQVMVPEFNMGAMENPGCITFNEAYIFRSKVTDAARSKRANTILHEMAHMWFGDLVTMRWWDDLWLNESFATYMATLAVHEATRFKDSYVDFANSVKSWAARQDQLPSTHPIAADMSDTEAVRLNFDGITYAKGASVLRQLVAWVGDDAFREGLRAYIGRYAWSNATLDDFLAALERTSGRDLRSWSREWLETAGIDTIRPEVRVEDGRVAAVSLVQTAPEVHPTLRSHRLALGLYSFDGSSELARRRRVELDVTGERTDVPELVGEPVPDLLLVNDGDLAFAKVRLDGRSAGALVSSMGRIADPLARALCWATAWDMVRDAELPTRRYAELVARQAGAEREVSALERCLSQALMAVDVHGDPANRGAARRRLRDAADEALGSAAPGSDLQLAWARFLISVSDEEEDLRMVEGLLDGSREIEGLAVDTDLRWHIVGRLAASGRIGGDRIEAELRRDPTDIGARRAAAAWAGRPLAAAKEEAWRRAVEEVDLPLAMARSIAGGFHQPGQDDLLEPYVGRYVEALPVLWRRSPEEAVALTEALFPRYLAGDDVLAAADRALAREDLPGPARRILVEERDGVLRARRARGADAAAGASPRPHPEASAAPA